MLEGPADQYYCYRLHDALQIIFNKVFTEM